MYLHVQYTYNIHDHINVLYSYIRVRYSVEKLPKLEIKVMKSKKALILCLTEISDLSSNPSHLPFVIRNQVLLHRYSPSIKRVRRNMEVVRNKDAKTSQTII